MSSRVESLEDTQKPSGDKEDSLSPDILKTDNQTILDADKPDGSNKTTVTKPAKPTKPVTTKKTSTSKSTVSKTKVPPATTSHDAMTVSTVLKPSSIVDMPAATRPY